MTWRIVHHPTWSWWRNWNFLRVLLFLMKVDRRSKSFMRMWLAHMGQLFWDAMSQFNTLRCFWGKWPSSAMHIDDFVPAKTFAHKWFFPKNWLHQTVFSIFVCAKKCYCRRIFRWTDLLASDPTAPLGIGGTHFISKLVLFPRYYCFRNVFERVVWVSDSCFTDIAEL